MNRLTICLAAVALSCGGDGSGSTIDAPPPPIIDAAAVDTSSPTVDSSPGSVDARPATDGSSPGIDASSPTGDASTACNGVGTPCTTTCPPGLNCYGSGAGGVCAPLRDGCLGFAGASCDDPAFPICMELSGTDYGLCVDAREQDCICAGAPATVDKC